MTKSELLELLANGENSGVEFKDDQERPERLAKEIVALANFRGGKLLLGVADDGTITGIQRDDLEQWVMDAVFARKVHPMILPLVWESSGREPDFEATQGHLQVTLWQGTGIDHAANGY